MFRQRLNEMQPESDQFISRVCELPVVNDALTQLTSIYSGVKGHNRLFRFTLETAESGVQAVVSRTVPPVVSTFEKPINTLNSIACNQLDKLEHEYPIITKPSEEVISETKQICDSALKPLVNRVSAVKQYGIDKVSNAKSYTTDKIDSVKTYGWDKLHTATDVGSKQMIRVLGSPLCHEVVKNVDTVLGMADSLVDKWLPEGVDAGEPRYDVSESALVTRAASVDKSLKDHAVVVGKAANIGYKVRRRMYARLANRLTNLQLRTKETIEHLNFTVDLIEYSRTSVTNAKDKAWYVWAEINKSDEELAKELTEGVEPSRLHADSTFERKALATARHLTQKLKNMFHNIGIPTDKLPTVISAQLDRARDLAHSLASSVPFDITKEQGIPKFAIDNIRNYASLLLQTTSWMTEWVRQAPVVGRFVPVIPADEPIVEPSSTDSETSQFSSSGHSKEVEHAGDED